MNKLSVRTVCTVADCLNFAVVICCSYSESIEFTEFESYQFR